MHGQFTRKMPETVDKDKTSEWNRKGDLKVETAKLTFAAQEQALKTTMLSSTGTSPWTPRFVVCVAKRVKQ